ncbi:hypothetical protein N8904_00435 [Flavobacteriales bacterium]|nr:hypothetical protein [Flavobacteriales bacterium]
MNILQELIHSMNREELRTFRLISNRVKTSNVRKEFLLLSYCKRSGQSYNEDKISKKLYGTNKNAFYRLKNRLLFNLFNSVTFQYLSKDNDLSTYKLILVGKKVKERGHYDLCYTIFKLAEKKAEKLELFELLNILYLEIIKLSYEKPDIDVESYLVKRKGNNQKLQQLNEIEDVLAIVNFKMKKDQNHSNINQKTIKLLEKTINDYSVNPEVLISPTLKLKIIQTISKLLLQKKMYEELETYLKQSYKECVSSNIFTEKTHEVKLQVLSYLTNCLFKNKKYDESISSAQELRTAIDEFDGVLYNKYIFYYYNGLVINYSKLDKDKAIDVLLKAKNEDAIKASDYYYFFVCSNLALQYFDKKNFKPAIKNLSRIIQHKNFLNFDLSFQIKIIAAELIIRYEIGDFDILEMRIKSVKTRFKDILTKPRYNREKLLIKIISKLIYIQRADLNKSLRNDINLILSIATSEEAEETDIINYNKWLSENFSRN